MRTKERTRSRKLQQHGFMLIELLISMVVLTVGLGGILILLISAMYTNKRSASDTTSTMVAEHVLEQITAQPANSNVPLQITDCAGTAWAINTAGAALNGGSGANGGNGANLRADPASATREVIDWTQAYAAVPAGYGIQYVACGAGGRQETYDIRWNVITMSAYARMVMISARPVGTQNSGAVAGLRFVIPVTLRSIDGV